MLKLEDIHQEMAGRPILRGVSLRVPTGQTHALIGTSGSGKTTLLRVALGVLPFQGGRVQIDGTDLAGTAPAVWAEKLGYVPQDSGLFPHLTARANAALLGSVRGWNRSRLNRRLAELARVVDLDPRLLRRYPHELSGGQRQRVALIRASLLDPPVLLLDEPMGALDPLVRHTLQGELKDIFQRLGKTVVLVTHDLGEAAFLADELTLLHNGRVVQTGKYRDFTESPADPFVTAFLSAQRVQPGEGS